MLMIGSFWAESPVPTTVFCFIQILSKPVRSVVLLPMLERLPGGTSLPSTTYNSRCGVAADHLAANQSVWPAHPRPPLGWKFGCKYSPGSHLTLAARSGLTGSKVSLPESCCTVRLPHHLHVMGTHMRQNERLQASNLPSFPKCKFQGHCQFHRPRNATRRNIAKSHIALLTSSLFLQCFLDRLVHRHDGREPNYSQIHWHL